MSYDGILDNLTWASVINNINTFLKGKYKYWSNYDKYILFCSIQKIILDTGYGVFIYFRNYIKRSNAKPF